MARPGHPGRGYPTAEQPVREQVAELGRVVDGLILWTADQLQQRDRAIGDARTDAEAKLQAEAQRLRDLVAQVEGKLRDLDQRTTGDLRLRLDELLLLLFVGIVFTTWPNGVADCVSTGCPGHSSTLALIGYVACGWSARPPGRSTRASP